MHKESLSFTLRPVESHEDLQLACQVRAEAYGYKVPAYRESMLDPDAIDLSPLTTVFLCQDKVTGRPVGSMRIQAAYGSRGEVELEKYVPMLPSISASRRGEISRLSAPVGVDPFIRLSLWKAGYLACKENNIRWLVMGVRKPALIRAYEQMGARDIYEDKREFPLAHGGGLNYRVFALDIEHCYEHWSVSGHPLLNFMTTTTHPDIAVVPPSVDRRPAEEVGLHIV